MKKPLLLLALGLLAASPLAAQEFRCESFGTTTDHTAAGTVYDLNGNPCALLRIVSKDKGCRFEGNIVGEPTFTGDGYLLHVPGRTRRITVLHDNYLPYVYQIGKIVRPDSVYELRLGTQPLPVDPASIREPALRFRSFETRTTDLAAKLNPVYDEQQEPCALIRVCVVCKGCDFEGNVVGEPTFSLNRYSVYVPAGTRRITVLHKGFEPFDFDFDREIEKNITYELTLYALIPEGFDAADARRRQEREFAELLRAAEQGDAEAQYRTGSCYMQGRGTTKNSAKAVEWFRASAERGYAKAQLALGRCYQQGLHGHHPNADQAFAWYRKAAEQGDVEAFENLGLCYYTGPDYTGTGVAQDYGKAMEWFEKAAEGGSDLARYYLGYCNKYGLGTQPDLTLSVKWFRLAAEPRSGEENGSQWQRAARYELALCLDEGKGAARNTAEAVRLYRLAAEQGHPTAQKMLGNKFFYGDGVSEDRYEAVKWYRLAAEQKLSAAQYNLGRCYENGWGVERDYTEAAAWYWQAALNANDEKQRTDEAAAIIRAVADNFIRQAGRGDAAAQYYLGLCYRDGIGVERKRMESVRWLLLAAEQNLADAQYLAGEACFKGEGIRQNRTEGIRWLLRAAEQGHAEAQCCLGKYYNAGAGVAQSDEESVKWYLRAAEQGVTDAQYIAGGCYYEGIVVGKDYAEAVKWFREAAGQGDERAFAMLSHCFFRKEGLDPNDAHTVAWFEKFAGRGYAHAQYVVGYCYQHGTGVRQDLLQAGKWYRKAAKQSLRQAIEALESMNGQDK